MKIAKFTVLLILLFASAQLISAQDLKGSWKGEVQTKLTTRDGEMEFTKDAKGLKTFSLVTSFYFSDTQNYHECSVDFARNDRVSKWATKGNMTKIIDENENQTTVTKTRNGFIIQSGCSNTQFYKVAFTRRGNRYIGREIK